MNTATLQETPIKTILFPATLEKSTFSSITKHIKPLINKQQRLIINLSNVQSLDWQGATYLLELWKKINKKQGMMVISHASPEVQAYLELIQMQRIVTVVDDQKTAMSILA